MRTRLLAAALAAYTIVVVSGAPLPLATVAAWCLPAVSEDANAERFPCEACPCGCGTAEHCWNDCCCHTMPQRLAWAKKEGVRPPESALDSAERAGLDTSDWRDQPKCRVVVAKPVNETPLAELPPCCRAARLARESGGGGAPLFGSPREAGTRRPGASLTGAPPPPNPKSDPGVALLSAMACQGLAEAWLSLGEAPLTTPPEPTEAPVLFVASQSPAPLWRTRTEAPTPPPPDLSV